MTEPGQNVEKNAGMTLADLEEALGFVRSDASDLLKDLLRGIFMWGLTALMAFFLAAAWLVVSQIILVYAHPYGSPPLILDVMYASYGFAVGSACLGLILLWRYFSLRRRYVRLFEIAGRLR